jgi:hypothetical protein
MIEIVNKKEVSYSRTEESDSNIEYIRTTGLSNKDMNEIRSEIDVKFNNEELERNYKNSRNNNVNNTESKSENCILFNKKVKYLILISIIIGFVFGWTIMSIIALITDSRNSIENDCKGKFFWEYLLIIMILNNLMTVFVIRKIYRMYNYNKVCGFIPVVICIIVQLIIVSFGVALLNNNCVHNNLRHTLIYASIASWILWQSLIIFILVLFGAIIAYCCG